MLCVHREQDPGHTGATQVDRSELTLSGEGLDRPRVGGHGRITHDWWHGRYGDRSGPLAAVLTPIVPSRLAGAALTAFSGGLLGMYARTPELRQPGSIWPSQKGTAVSKDAWLFGIGLSLLASGRRR